ncbi:restriction endonuclease subunit S [Patescibacteria group bacterium]|nr:restriction endonuclease subunit S [Patescibacteria group bacterium]
MKTEIKAKTFLNLEITLPSIEHQKSIVQRLERFNAQN